MKVISGILKGRLIKGYDIEGTRPTMDRVKESIFGMIQDYVKESIVLDLFAGTGSIGIEALSNYAKLVYFNDKNIECVKLIKKNLEDFHLKEKGIVYNFDYLKCLNVLCNDKVKFDLIFLDPPYKFHVLNDLLKLIVEKNLLNKKGLIIVEFEDYNLENDIDGLKLIKTREYGSKKVYIYERISYEE